MTEFIPRNFVVAIAVIACCSMLGAPAEAQGDRAAQRKASRERAMGNASNLAPLSMSASDANDCVAFRLQQSGVYADNGCEYRVNIRWCPIVATKQNDCIEQDIGARTVQRLSPFTNVTKYRGLACYAPSRPVESGSDVANAGIGQLECKK